MSMQTRGLVFATFFGNCLVVGLLVASLTTDWWVHAQAKRHSGGGGGGSGANGTLTAAEAGGRVNFGLFAGYKDLNVGYGTRPVNIDVVAFMRAEPAAMNWWLWLGAALGVGFGTFAAAVGAIASVLKSASFGKKRGTMVLLFVSNCASAISQMLAFICWLVQFYEYLTHNVLTLADRNENSWYSTGMSQLGHSFYFLGAAILIVLVNLLLLTLAVRLERQERRRNRHDDPAYDEKQQGAIMLY